MSTTDSIIHHIAALGWVVKEREQYVAAAKDEKFASQPNLNNLDHDEERYQAAGRSAAMVGIVLEEG